METKTGNETPKANNPVKKLLIGSDKNESLLSVVFVFILFVLTQKPFQGYTAIIIINVYLGKYFKVSKLLTEENIEQFIVLSIGNLYKLKQQVLYFKPYKQEGVLKMSDLKEIYHAAIKLTKNKPLPYMSDIRGLKKAPNLEERIYMQNTFHHFATKGAIIENNSIVRYATHLILYLTPPKIPLRMFKNEDEALKWLLKPS